MVITATETIITAAELAITATETIITAAELAITATKVVITAGSPQRRRLSPQDRRTVQTITATAAQFEKSVDL
ncbi:MAG: hypothetical protein IJ523_07605 [Succinivibrionaceae bacterium]|nr:hypothetical protein [Succinivibrionaceae bacterium]